MSNFGMGARNGGIEKRRRAKKGAERRGPEMA